MKVSAAALFALGLAGTALAQAGDGLPACAVSSAADLRQLLIYFIQAFSDNLFSHTAKMCRQVPSGWHWKLRPGSQVHLLQQHLPR